MSFDIALPNEYWNLFSRDEDDPVPFAATLRFRCEQFEILQLGLNQLRNAAKLSHAQTLTRIQTASPRRMSLTFASKPAPPPQTIDDVASVASDDIFLWMKPSEIEQLIGELHSLFAESHRQFLNQYPEFAAALTTPRTEDVSKLRSAKIEAWKSIENSHRRAAHPLSVIGGHNNTPARRSHARHASMASPLGSLTVPIDDDMEEQRAEERRSSIAPSSTSTGRFASFRASIRSLLRVENKESRRSQRDYPHHLLSLLDQCSLLELWCNTIEHQRDRVEQHFSRSSTFSIEGPCDGPRTLLLDLSLSHLQGVLSFLDMLVKMLTVDLRAGIKRILKAHCRALVA